MKRDALDTDETILSYVESVSNQEPPLLAELREETAAHPLSIMQVSPLQGQLLQILVKMIGAQRIVEVGVFTGYSSLCMALALPEDGKLIALDVDARTAKVAKRYWERADVDHKVELQLAPAADSMQGLIDAGAAGSIDLIFIDADKPAYGIYWEHGLRLLRPGGVIAIDNTLFQGGVAHAHDEASAKTFFADWPEEIRESMVTSTLSLRKFNESVAGDTRVDRILLPLFDGLTLAVKR